MERLTFNMATIISMDDFRKPIEEEGEEIFDLGDVAVSQLEQVADILNHFLEGGDIMTSDLLTAYVTFAEVVQPIVEQLGELEDE